MRRLPTRLDGLVLLEPTAHGDERGFFVESYRENVWAEHGVPGPFVQDNHSRSRRGVVRGMHFSIGGGQAKLVRCARGRIWDVAVDVREGSPTYGEWEAFELDDEGLRALPAGRLRARLLRAQRRRRRRLQVLDLLRPGRRAGLPLGRP